MAFKKLKNTALQFSLESLLHMPPASKSGYWWPERGPSQWWHPAYGSQGRLLNVSKSFKTCLLYRYMLHNDLSVHNRLHIRQWPKGASQNAKRSEDFVIPLKEWSVPKLWVWKIGHWLKYPLSLSQSVPPPYVNQSVKKIFPPQGILELYLAGHSGAVPCCHFTLFG